jgi:hypothetical protein
MSAFDPKQTLKDSNEWMHIQRKDRLAAVLLNKISVAKAQRVLMRIEAGCPDSLKRLTGVIFVPLTFRMERSWSR